jgi:hypothetical protein
VLIRKLLLLFALVALSGCIGHYRYESQGEVSIADSQQRAALLYWYVDDGRLWYGKAYKQPDSSLGLIVCGTPPSNFDGGDAGDPLVLKSRSGDRQVVELNEQGRVVELSDSGRLPVGSSCGGIDIDGKPATSDHLVEGAIPRISILCDNPGRPGRYPVAGIYVFGEVSRAKVENREAPDTFCNPPR